MAAIAFSNAARVSTCDGRVSDSTSFIASSPAATAACGFPGCVAGTSFRPGALTPRKSSAVAIVFAVNWPPHAPAPGHATLSSACTSASVIDPAACAPTASKMSWIVTSLPR